MAQRAGFLAVAKKAVASGVGLVAGALAAGFLDGKWEAVAYAVVSLATVAGVYQAKNARPVAGHNEGVIGG